MKKLIASALVAAAIALPAAPAVAADDSAAWWGRKPCASWEAGTVIWHDTPATEYQEIHLCFPRVGPDASKAADMSARAGVYRCGGTGIIVWYYDLQNRYHEPVHTCL